MPVATIKTALGVAKDTANTYLAAGAAAGATSLSLQAASVPASSTVTIVDGPLTEQRAVSAGGGSTTLTVAATP